MTPINITPFTTQRILETVGNSNKVSFDIKKVCFIDTGGTHGAVSLYGDVPANQKKLEITDDSLINTAVINNNTIQISFVINTGNVILYDRVYLLNDDGKEIIVIDINQVEEEEIILNLNMPMSAEISSDTSGCS